MTSMQLSNRACSKAVEDLAARASVFICKMDVTCGQPKLVGYEIWHCDTVQQIAPILAVNNELDKSSEASRMHNLP